MVPEKYMFVLNINPMVYIVEGYRNTFLYNKWFWESTEYLPYFLSYTLFFLLLGVVVFRKLRPHFGDVGSSPRLKVRIHRAAHGWQLALGVRVQELVLVELLLTAAGG